MQLEHSIEIDVEENEKEEHVRSCLNPVYPVVIFWDYKEQSLHYCWCMYIF